MPIRARQKNQRLEQEEADCANDGKYPVLKEMFRYRLSWHYQVYPQLLKYMPTSRTLWLLPIPGCILFGHSLLAPNCVFFLVK